MNKTSIETNRNLEGSGNRSKSFQTRKTLVENLVETCANKKGYTYDYHNISMTGSGKPHIITQNSALPKVFQCLQRALNTAEKVLRASSHVARSSAPLLPVHSLDLHVKWNHFPHLHNTCCVISWESKVPPPCCFF